MRIFSFVSYVLFGSIMVGLGMYGGLQDQSEREIPLQEAAPPPPNTQRLLELSGILKVEPTQKLASGGILFRIELINESDHPLTLKNPLDFLNYTLIDQEGNTIQLPGRSLKFFINTRRPLPNHAFRVLGLSAGGEEVTDRDQDSETIRVPSAAGYRMDLLIEKVSRSSSDRTPVPISAGTYTFSVSLGLMRDDGRASLQLRAPAIEISLRSEG